MAEDESRRYRIDLAYDGTNYAGWQVQPNGLTVQEAIETRLAQLVGRRPKVHGSGRTDQGVHARRQVAHCDLATRMTAQALRNALNALLPADIRILRVRTVPADFHARKSAVGKEYRYFIWNGRVLPPIHRLYMTHVRRRLDVAAMQAAADRLTGRHDFAAFASNPGRVLETTVRRVDALTVRRSGSRIVVSARGEGFLYRMVRSITGLLIRVGEGTETPSAARAILASRERTARVPTAPPQGLFLWRVMY